MKESTEHTTLRLAALQLAMESLELILSAHLSIVIALLAQPGKCGAKVLRAAKGIHRTVRQQMKIIYQLRAQALHADLKTNPAFRARVASDLGGTMAMARWERRKRDARTHQQFLAARKAEGLASVCDPVQPPSPSQQIVSPDTNPRKAWRPRTDRTGHFRLAIISTGAQRKTAKPRKITTRIVKHTHRLPRPYSLIEVTPRELRPPAFSSYGYPALPDIGMPSAGNSPPIDRWPRH